jgi:hypothetical protein
MKRLTVLVILLASIACTREVGDKDEVLRAIYRTETRPRTFAATEKGAETATVKGTIVDDYRYRVDFTLDGKLYASEIVIDDARALRFASREAVEAIGSPVAGITDGGWVVDPHGANNLFPEEATAGRLLPTTESLQGLKDVRSAMGEAAIVLKFNPDSQDYRPRFDPFPPPAEGVIRYDLVPPVLTPRDPTSSGNADQVPSERYFRRMSIYVADGAVTEVRGRISIADMLEDPRSRILTRIGDYNIAVTPGAPVRTQAREISEQLNRSAQGIGVPAIVERDLHLRFGELRTSDDVRLPSNAKRMKLDAIANDVQVLYERPG